MRHHLAIRLTAVLLLLWLLAGACACACGGRAKARVGEAVVIELSR